jgi:4-phospho-D-threonate 3-dehydrogenase / 4-phospho-D-erythronate 3-dehydrogenase
MDVRPHIAITMGDPAGIGPELCLRILEDASVLETCMPAIIGDAGVLERVAGMCRLRLPRRIVSLEDWMAAPAPGEPAIVDCAAIDGGDVTPGLVDAACGRATYAYIEAACRAALDGRAAAVATAPVHKEALHQAGIPYPGHTEIFTALTGSTRSCMMLLSDELIASFVTTHIGYAEVPQRLTTERILDVIELTAEVLPRVGNRPGPIAVCALNPHAGEGGLFGTGEEERLIIPAILAARAKGIPVEGPLPADSAFIPARRRATAAFVCMYHDQGHIPFKLLAFDRGVNVTLGLPIVRTSVDHGTAFDIAWTGRADPTSLGWAVRWAARLADSDDRRPGR